MYIEKKIVEICRKPYNLSHTSGITGWTCSGRKCSISELLAWAWMGLFALLGGVSLINRLYPPVNHPENGVAAVLLLKAEWKYARESHSVADRNGLMCFP